MFGAKVGPYLRKADWDLTLAWRGFRADRQFTGVFINQLVARRMNQVIDRAQILYLSATRGLNDQDYLSLTIPYQVYGGASHGFPGAVVRAPRFLQKAQGVGDSSLVYNHWLRDTNKHTGMNLSLGLGVSIPTGVNDTTGIGPDSTGKNIVERGVDTSIMPGQGGGYGVVANLLGFKVIGPRSVYVNAACVANPVGQNDSFSPKVIFNPAGTVGVDPRQVFNSVTDQYLVRAGAIFPSKSFKNLSLQLGDRWEGVPVNDLFGSSIGFRRPGYTISLEPGLIYSRGNLTANFSVNHVMQQNRLSNFGVQGDSSFADAFYSGGITYRFNASRGKSRACPPPAKVQQQKAL